MEIGKLNAYVKYKSEKNIREKALKEGHEQGIENGREEATRELIMNMINENYDIKDISRLTKKTKEEILEIKKSLELK